MGDGLLDDGEPLLVLWGKRMVEPSSTRFADLSSDSVCLETTTADPPGRTVLPPTTKPVVASEWRVRVFPPTTTIAAAPTGRGPAASEFDIAVVVRCCPGPEPADPVAAGRDKVCPLTTTTAPEGGSEYTVPDMVTGSAPGIKVDPPFTMTAVDLLATGAGLDPGGRGLPLEVDGKNSDTCTWPLLICVTAGPAAFVDTGTCI